MDNNLEKDLSHVAKIYNHDAFSEEKAWHNMSIVGKSRWRLTNVKIAAAVAALVVIGATAALISYHTQIQQENLPTSTEVSSTPAVPREVVHAIDFEDAPLDEVIAEIESTYGVTVKNVPSETSMQRITLYFEGDANDLISMINDILDTNLTIE